MKVYKVIDIVNKYKYIVNKYKNNLCKFSTYFMNE